MLISQKEVSVRIACSLDKLELFQQLATQFNAMGYESTDGTRMVIECTPIPLEPDLEVLSADAIDAVTPESSLWLRDLDRNGTGDSTRSVFVCPATLFAASPIAIAMWEDVACMFGYPKHPISWKDILEKTQENQSFRWGHPSIYCPTGQLAILAMVGKDGKGNQEITQADLQSSITLTKLNQLQQTITYYAPSELDLITRAKEEGRQFLDAFIIQEHFAIRFNRDTHKPLVIAIPIPGVVWADHPIALLRQLKPQADKITLYQHFCRYLLSSEVQARFLSSGFHPIGSQIRRFLWAERERIEVGIAQLEEPDASYSIAFSSDLSSLSTMKAFAITKKNTNVLLVTDTSGSMSGNKLDRVKEALLTFVVHVTGQDEQMGLVAFNSTVKSIVPIASLRYSREKLVEAVDCLCVGGQTALIDAIDFAYVQLQQREDRDRINAIVALTDGLENASRTTIHELIHKITIGNENLTPVLVYCVAYGADADFESLELIASASRGKAYQGDSTDITQIYNLLSRMF